MEIIVEELNSQNLEKRTENVLNCLVGEIKLIQSGDERKISQEGTNKLKTLTNDFQELVQRARNILLNNPSKEIREIASKIDRIWRKQIYPLMQKYDECVDNYNSSGLHKTKLEYICKRTGTEIVASVQSYFPY